MARLDTFLNFLGHYKYLITIVLGILFCGVLSESSVMKLINLDMQKEDLQNEIKLYQDQDAESKRELRDLKSSPNAVEKVARERYFMKKDDEDVFVLSTDEPSQPQQEEETTEEKVADTE